jgi:SAM-dependent methyltransferase
MRRKIELGSLAVLVLAGLTFIIISSARQGSEDVPAGPAEPETTIRNVTNEVVHYWIKLYDSAERPRAKVLSVGAIDRYPGNGSLAVTFLKGGRTEENVLGAGLPYSFRYDENGEIQIYQGAHGRADAADLAPYVGTPMPVVEKMLEMAGVGPRDVVYDIGCGDGRIVIEAAKKYGARGVGIDIDPRRIAESRAGAKAAGVEKMVKFLCEDATKSDISAATVVTTYLLPESNELLRPIFEAQLKPGARVVCHNYDIAGWKSKEIDSTTVKDQTGADHTIFLYRR